MLDVLRCILFDLYLNIIGAIYVLKEQILDRHRPLDLSHQEGKTVVITGGNRGIGLEAVKKLLVLKCRVIIGCRNTEQAERSLANEDMTRVTILPLDLMNMESVSEFAGRVKGLNVPVFALINNAGIMFGSRVETKDGFESQLSTNYLGHFLLSHLLLPLLDGEGGRPGRIVNVSSCAHYVGSWLNFEDLNLRQFYSSKMAYGNSKAAQVMFSQYLDSRLSGSEPRVRVVALHPGVVHTDLYSQVGWVQIFTWAAKIMMKTPSQGGDILVYAALAPELDTAKTTGLYIENSRLRRISSFTASIQNQATLWNETCKMLNIQSFGNLSL